MSIQTTRYITRAEAINRYVDKQKEVHAEEYVAAAMQMDDEELAEAIEEIYDNFTITDQSQ